MAAARSVFLHGRKIPVRVPLQIPARSSSVMPRPSSGRNPASRISRAHSYNVLFSLHICRSKRGIVGRFCRYSNGTATVRNLGYNSHLENRSGTQPADMGGDRMLLFFISLTGLIVGVIAAGKSTTVITESEALILTGISLIGVAIYLRRRKGMRG